jgi:hypothetical protein
MDFPSTIYETLLALRANKVVQQASQSASGNLASRCDLSSTAARCGRTLSSRA